MPVKKVSTVSAPSKAVGGLNELMSAESFRSSSLLVTLTLLIVLSTVLLVLVTVLIGSFRIPLLTMASQNFLAGPVLMVISSCLGVVLAVAGFALVFKRHFSLYMALAGCSLLAFLFQLVAVVLAFLLRDNIDSDFNKVDVEAELGAAASDPAVMAVWDSIQSRYQCCGGRGNSGFLQWEEHLNGTYPDSCCTVSYPDCGRQAGRSLQAEVYERIHVRGCLTVVGRALQDHVMPLLLAWGLLGLLVALAELMLVALCLLFGQHLRQAGGRGPVGPAGDGCPVHGERRVSSLSTTSRLSSLSSTAGNNNNKGVARRGSVLR